MHPKRAMGLFIASVASAAGLVVSPASAQDINGGSSWGGWDLRGQSTDQGIYGSGSTDIVYELYTTSFLFNGQTVTGSPAFGGLQGGPMDLSGFQTGDRILGVGIRAVSGLPAWNGSDPWATNPFVIFDLDKDSYTAATTVGGTDGQASPSTYGHAGDFNVQANGDYNNLYRPNVMTVFTDDGTFWGGTGSFASYAGSNPTHETDLWPDVRSFFDPSNGSWQMLFNLDTLQNTRGIPAIGNEFRIITAVNSNGADTRSVLDVSIVPASGPDINGGSSWNGWNLIGDSQTSGIWVLGSTTRTFEIYSTEFILDPGQLVSGTRVADGAPGNGSDYTGDTAESLFAGSWQAGDRIIGMGIRYTGDTRGTTFFFHTDAGGDNIFPASSFGVLDGVFSHDAGDTSSYMCPTTFLARGRVCQYSVWFDFSPDGSPESGNYLIPYGTQPTLAMPTRSFKILENGSLNRATSTQFFINVDAILRSNGGATFGEGVFDSSARFGFWEGDQSAGTQFSQQIFSIPTPCPADLDGNGLVDFGDVLTVLAAWGPCVGCPADFDGNGLVDFGDLLTVLAAWGPCD